MSSNVPSRGLRLPHAVVMMLCIIVAAVAFTWVVPSGAYERSADGLVVPGSYRAVRKDRTSGRPGAGAIGAGARR